MGSTSLKQTKSRTEGSTDESLKGPVWFSAIQGFYFEAAQAFLREWSDKKDISEKPDSLYGEEPVFWKSIGDEVLFTKVLSDHRQLATTLQCWFEAIRRMKFFLRNESSSLDVKSTVWLAGFPFRNREVAIARLRKKEEYPVENYYKESGILLNQYYAITNKNDISIDYIGPSIDTGFRLTGFSSGRKLVLSVDAAYLLSMTNFDGEIKRIDLHYEGSHTLKGVLGSAPYPIFWINMSGESSLAVKEDKLKSQTTCNKEDVKEYCDAFYEEYKHFTFRPFIKGDVGETMAKSPEWYEEYHRSLVKNFTIPDNSYDNDVNDLDIDTKEIPQSEIDSLIDDIVTNENTEDGFRFTAGDNVRHAKFGTGKIQSLEGIRATVDFKKVGVKRLLIGFLKKE